MYRKVTMYQIVCEGCGTVLNEEEMVTAWGDKGWANEQAQIEGWYIDGEHHYCPACCEYDEETDEYKPKATKDGNNLA